MEPYSYWVVAVAAFLSSVFFSIAEGALLGYSRSKLEARLRTSKLRERFHAYLEHEERLLFTSSALATFSRVLLIVAITAIAITHRTGGGPEPSWVPLGARGLALVSLEAVAAALVFAVALGASGPRAWGHWKAEAVVLWTLPTLVAADRVALPLTGSLRLLNAVVARLSGVDEDADDGDEIVDEIRSAAIEGEAEGVLEEHHKAMLERVIEFKDVDVAEVLTPRTDIDAIDVSMGLPGAVAFAMEHGHSRIPVYEGTIDKIVGICYAKDLMKALASEPDERPESLEPLLRKPLFIPKTKSVGVLLQDFRKGKAHMAIVLDEYGGTAGLVTIEDIIEEIVGDIEDEYDAEEEAADAPVRRLAEDLVDVEGKLRIDELNEVLGVDIPEDGDYETVGGFLFSSFGKIPSVGESYTHDNVELTVTDADERKINRVKIKVNQRA